MNQKVAQESYKMKNKTQKPKGIPLESIFLSPDFQRSYEELMAEEPGATDPALKAAITAELISNASRRVKNGQRLKRLSSSGGNATAEVKAEENADRDSEIIKLHKEGVTKVHLSERKGLSIRQISNILKKEGNAP